MSDEAQIRQLITAEVDALREKDGKAVVSRYAPEIVKYDLAPPLRHSGPEVTDPGGVQQWLDGFDGPVYLTIQDLAVTVGGDVAFAHSLNRMSSTPAGESFDFAMWFRATYGLRKIDGEWRISHEHTSTPFYMDGSFKAAADLQP